uniref:VWFA domain-containing protein n=1 Tax=Haemonchus placei TaxID=6290 RepID=A0A0N4W8Y3_HAEPC
LLQDYITKGVANNFSALVINMGDSSFNSWPENTDIWMNSMDDTKQIADYVSRFVCASPPKPIPVENINSGCECVPKTIWLDVFLLMEAGMSMTSYGIASATDFVVSAFTKLTVGQAEQFQTRLGVIRYASSVDLVADLDAYKSTADLLDLDISPLNETDTNLEGYVKYFHKSRIQKVCIRLWTNSLPYDIYICMYIQ